MIGLLAANTGWAQSVPNQFTAGTPAVAGDVNANFADVDARIATNLADGQATAATVDQLFATLTLGAAVEVEEEFLAVATCPVDTVAVSADCACTGDGITANFGVLNACFVIPDGAVAVCFDDFSFDVTLPFSNALVGATCVGGTLVNGAAAFPTPQPAIVAQKSQVSDKDAILIDIQNKASARMNAAKIRQ